MTTLTTQGSEDDFERIERGIDWIERLENIRARQDKESATQETVQYVGQLREALIALTGDTSPHDLATIHGAAIAELVDSIRDSDATAPWTEYLLPALLS